MVEWVETKVYLQMAVKNTKTCPNCYSKRTKKIGIENKVQRYKCNDCSKKFHSIKKTFNTIESHF